MRRARGAPVELDLGASLRIRGRSGNLCVRDFVRVRNAADVCASVLASLAVLEADP